MSTQIFFMTVVPKMAIIEYVFTNYEVRPMGFTGALKGMNGSDVEFDSQNLG